MKKTSRTFKRFAAITSASLLAACMVAPMASFAETEETKYTITINSNGNVEAANHTLGAYQIFTGDLKDSTLSNVEWGSNITDGPAFIKALQANETLNAITEIAALKSVAEGSTPASTPGDVAAALAKIEDKSDNAKILADVISTQISGEAVKTGSTSIGGLTAGYYFVKDVGTSGEAAGDAKTKFILSVVKDTDVTLKTDAPTLEKKIWHNDTAEPTIGDTAPQGTSWGDVGDNQIGDKVYYYTKTSVPDMSNYTTYKYIIRDSMCDGLTMGDVTNIVYVTDGGVATKIYEKATITKQDDAKTTDFTEDFYVTFEDLKTALPANSSGGYIYTYYTATLNENAKVSDEENITQFNENKAYLEYSNNPNTGGEGQTGKTNEDIVYDWTFTTGAIKVDEDNNPVPGAGFTLYDGDDIVKLTKIDSPSNAGLTPAADTAYYRVDPEGDVTQMDLTTTDVNKFVILGLDDSTDYTLKETKIPGGYNTCPDQKFKITAAYNDAGNGLITLTSNNSENPIKIENRKGSILPGTGGIGTTVFYLGGGAMVAVAGIYLISKKRMKNTQE